MVRKAVSEGAATKADIGEVRAEIAGVRAEIGELRSEVRTEIAGVRAEIGEFKRRSPNRGGVVKAELWAIKWVLGFLFAIVVAMPRGCSASSRGRPFPSGVPIANGYPSRVAGAAPIPPVIARIRSSGIVAGRASGRRATNGMP